MTFREEERQVFEAFLAAAIIETSNRTWLEEEKML